MKKTFLAACIALAAFVAFAKTSTPEGWLDDYDAALKKAAAEEKHIIVDFSGSDWCIWCKRLDKEVFDTDVFRKAAAEKYVLLMVDSPSKKSLLSPKAAKENPKLVEKFGVKGFPTVVVLNPKGEEVCRLGYEKGGPEKYLETLDAAIREAPDVEKYIKPIEDVLNRYDREMAEETRAAMDKVEEKFPRPDKNLPKEELKKYAREARKYAREIVFETVYSKYVPLYDKAFAEAKAMKVPEHMEAKKKELIDGQERIFNMLKDGLHEYEEAKKNGTLDELDEESEDDDEDAEPSGGRLDTWLKDWSENVRTNTAIETCASFRDTKLRPFLMAQMDPDGKATADERKLLEKSIFYIWGTGGYRRFDGRKQLVEILDRTAKKPFADMVRALVDKKDVSGPIADWIIDGKFTGEDMRCVFWTVRNNDAFDAPHAKEIADSLDKAGADEWLRLLFRIDAERDAAWAARGGGFANTVTEKGWQGYGDHGEACRAAYKRAWELHKYPEAAYLFTTLGPFDDEVFIGATAVQLDFEPLYDHFLWYNCYPRWCGSLAKMKAFAERCYETRRHDTMIPYLYATSLLRMVNDSGERQEEYFRAHPEELDKIIEVCLPQVTNVYAFGGIREKAGMVAALAYSFRGDWAKAGDTFASVSQRQGMLPDGIWNVIQEISHWCVIWEGISGANRKELQRMHAMFVAGDFKGFAKAAAKLRASGVKLDKKENWYLGKMELDVWMKTEFPAGKQRHMTFPKNKHSWITYGGYWKMDGKCAYQRGAYRPSSVLEWDVQVPGEFRLELIVGPYGKGEDWRFDFCQKPADPALAKADYPYVMLRFSKDGATAVYGEWDEVKDGGSGTPVPFAYAGGKVHLAIVYRGGKASVFVDGSEKPVIESGKFSRLLKAVSEGKFQFNGAGVRLLSMKVMRAGPAKEESGAAGQEPQAPAEALKTAIAPLTTSMTESVKDKAYSGGWGYDEKTAVVISAEDEISGVQLERPFLRLRSQSEVIAALEKTKLGTKADIDAIVPTVKSQGLISSGGRSYDSIGYEVCVKLTNGVIFTYDAECWFDITSFFGK